MPPQLSNDECKYCGKDCDGNYCSVDCENYYWLKEEDERSIFRAEVKEMNRIDAEMERMMMHY